MRYRISAAINFLTPEGSLGTAINELYPDSAERVLISDEVSGRSFVINATTKAFLEKFTLPKNLSEVSCEIAQEAKTPVQVIRNAITPFFRYIKAKGFIVPEKNLKSRPSDVGKLLDDGAVIDQYKVIRCIDSTASMDVYEAQPCNAELRVVIKLLKQPRRQSILALRREFDLLQMLNSTGASPKAWTFHNGEEYCYYTQERINGSGLPEHMAEKRTEPASYFIAMLFKIAKAFARIHDKGIVHGDIHPSNIMVTPEDEVRIIDFGLALGSEPDGHEIADFGGAYFYMPPERIGRTSDRKFTRKPDLASDVYQIGVVFYQLLFENFPFEGIIWEQLANNIKTQPLVVPARSRSGFLVPGWLTMIIQKCLARKAGDRFENAAQLYYSFSENSIRNGHKI